MQELFACQSVLYESSCKYKKMFQLEYNVLTFC